MFLCVVQSTYVAPYAGNATNFILSTSLNMPVEHNINSFNICEYITFFFFCHLLGQSFLFNNSVNFFKNSKKRLAKYYTNIYYIFVVITKV